MAKPKFKFKSTGTQRGKNRQFDNPVIIEQSIGLKTPMEFGDDQDNLHKTHKDPVGQIKDNLRNLILTNYGERLGRPSIGADLITLTFRADQIGDFLRLANIKITESVKKYMPFITINDVQYKGINNTQQQLDSFYIDDSIGLKKIILNINYNITQINLNNQILQITIFAGG
jgi:phage baseplate assembly protein W